MAVFKLYGLYSELIVPMVRRFKAQVTKQDQKAPVAGPAFPDSFVDSTSKEWTFHKDYLNQQQPEFFRRLLPQHLTLTLELSVLRARIAKDLAKPAKHQARLINQLQAALAISGVLEKLYCDYLEVPREVARLLDEQREYQEWLAQWGYQFTHLNLKREIKVDQGLATSQNIRGSFREVNPLRMFILRLRRLLLLMALVLSNDTHYLQWLKAVEVYAAPFFIYLAWMFFVPRLLVNLALIAKHVFNPYMSEAQRQIGWQTRLQAQLARRWQEIANDLAWFINGILLCFVLTAAPFATTIAIAIVMQAYDLLIACIQATIDFQNLRLLEQAYANAPPLYRKDLKKRLIIERNFIYLNLTNFVVLLIGMSLSLPPLLAISPIIPVVGAAFAVLMSVINFSLQQTWNSERQQKYGFFALPKPGALPASIKPSSSTDETLPAAATLSATTKKC